MQFRNQNLRTIRSFMYKRRCKRKFLRKWRFEKIGVEKITIEEVTFKEAAFEKF